MDSRSDCEGSSMGRKSLLSTVVVVLAMAGMLSFALRFRGPPDERRSRAEPIEITPQVNGRAGKEEDPEAADANPAASGTKLWTVAGRVLRARGRPAAGVAVRLASPLKETRTAGDGRFALAGLSPGEDLRLTIDEPASAIRIVRFDLPEAGDDPRKQLEDIVLEEPLSLAVKLKGPRGEPVANGRVSIDDAERDGEETAPGEFCFVRLPPGRHSLRARAPGFIRFGEVVDLPGEEPLIVTLEEGHRIAGTVRAADGTPIEGAELQYDSSEVTVKTDAFGRFLFDTLPEGNHEISARAKGFITDGKSLATGMEEAEFWLLRESVLAGRVLRADDRGPVADALVMLDDPEGHEKNQRSDQEGRFEFKELSPGRYSLHVEHGELLPAKGGDFELGQGDRIEGISISLKNGFSIRGSVNEEPGGAPVAGAEVSFSLKTQEDELELERQATTAEDGTFQMKGLQAGNFDVSARKSGFLSPETLDLFISQELEDGITLSMRKGSTESTIAGQVLDPDGKAAADSWIALVGDFLSKESADDQGHFRFQYVRPGEYRIEAHSPRFAAGSLAGIHVASGRSIEGLEVRLARGSVIRGRVLDERRQGIQGASAVLVPLRGLDLDTRRGDSDSAGDFEIKAVAAGPYMIHAEAGGRVDSASRFIVLGDGEDLDGQDFVLEPGAAIRGRVLDAGDRPLSGAAVSAGGQHASSGLDGSFELRGLPADWIDLHAEGEGFEPRDLKVCVSGQEVLVQMDRLASVSGMVHAGGRQVFPPGELDVQDFRPDGDPGNIHDSRIDATGRFQFQAKKGDHQLVAFVPGFVPSVARITLKAGEKREGVVIDLRSGGVIRGRTVRQGSGLPVEEVDLLVVNAPESLAIPRPEAFSDPDGFFVIEKVPEGDMDLTASGRGFTKVTLRGIAVREGEASEVTIELPPGGAIHGAVVGARSQNWGVVASLRGSDFSTSAPVGSSGRFQLSGLPAGEYDIKIVEFHPGDRRILTSGRAVVREDQVTEVDLQVDSIRLSGRVRSGGVPERFARLSALEAIQGLESEEKRADAEGYFELDLPGPGTYLVTVSPGVGKKALIEVKVPPGVKELQKDLELDRGQISGRVFDSSSGEPLDSAEVWALAPGFSARSLGSVGQAVRGISYLDDAGRFAISHLAPGRYSLLVRAAGSHLPVRIDGVDAGDGKDLPIALERGAGSTLKVMGEDGRPVEGAWAVLRDLRGDIVQVLDGDVSDDRGVLRLEGIRPGSYRGTIGHARYAPARLSIRVPADENPEIALRPGGTLRASVLGPAGEQSSGATVLLLDETGDDIAEELALFARDRNQATWTLLRPQVSGKDGLLTLYHVPAGTYRASARRGEARSAEARLQVAEGQLVEASFSLSE